ncbi:MAG TPA: hypothetical protein VJ461_04520 [Candidatus Nanoarchaeia archaeon]|nr:hypothetical protein [Candidatus Nanoarchaeia archaeon]
MDIKEKLKFYGPIDYTRWDASGKGKNVLHLLDACETRIWHEALPYQDKRNDPGHAEHVVYFALKLLSYYPDAKRQVVIPAAILHDTGWGMMPDEERALWSTPARKVYEPFLRQRHQDLGKKFADEMLSRIGFMEYHKENGQKYKEHICEIISQHDTRPGFYSLDDCAINDGLARDADKLWRPTLTAMLIESPRSKRTVEEISRDELASFEKPNFWYSPISKEIAMFEMIHAMNAYYKKQKEK